MEHFLNMNIKFNYLHRDGANYKNHNAVVFVNPNNKSKEELEIVIKNSMVDGMWFVANHWNLPDMHFQEYRWNSEIDHDWHECDCLEEISDMPTEKISIEDFLNQIQNKKAKLNF